MKYFQLFVFIFTIILASCNNQDKQILSRIDKMEKELKSEIDSLKNELQTKQNQIDSLLNLTKSKQSNLNIPLFIGKSKDFVKEFWSSRVSVEYFKEGIYDDTRNEFFSIMTKSIGMPLFAATFKNGKCIEHTTKINYSDISIMQTRLKNGGYKYDGNKKWTYDSANHYWFIDNPYGSEYFLKCKLK